MINATGTYTDGLTLPVKIEGGGGDRRILAVS